MNSLLASHKSETVAKLQQKLLQLGDDCLFQNLFQSCSIFDFSSGLF